MSGVKRYTFDIDERYLCDCGNGDRVIRVESGKDGYVLASDYDRLEHELRDIKDSMAYRGSLLGRTEAERDELRARVEAMRKEAEAMQDLLRKVAPHFAAPPGMGYLHQWIDAALQEAKP